MKLGPLWLKIQIACGDALAMGPGKADLLEAIIAHGSISAAGRALGMSYRRAWLLVDEMNRCFDPVVVETIKGGGRERGAPCRRRASPSSKPIATWSGRPQPSPTARPMRSYANICGRSR